MSAKRVIRIRGCLAQSGNPITFSAIGGGTLKIDFDDSQIPQAAELLAWREVPLILDICLDAEGSLIQRRGRPRKTDDTV